MGGEEKKESISITALLQTRIECNMKVATKNNLDIIADRLMDGHASLFVGAGFSKNA